MFSDRIYGVTLLISLVAHGAILLQSSAIKSFSVSSKKNPQKIEVSYIRTAGYAAAQPKTKRPASKTLLKLPARVTVENKAPAPFADRDNIFRTASKNVLPDSTLIKPALTKPDAIAGKKKITLPAIDINKINNPSYINYYQLVREKIRRCAYQNYARTETGEVYLSFIISNEGNLKEIRLIDERSSPSAYLREIALRSIREASAFPSFPKELDYPQLSFNVVISFEVEQ